jgi:ATP-dependent Lon protease
MKKNTTKNTVDSSIKKEKKVKKSTTTIVNEDTLNITTLQMLSKIPVVSVRDIVMFPGSIVSLFIGRVKSVNAVNSVLKSSRNLVFVTQLDSSKEVIDDASDLPNIGTMGNILQCIVLPDETIKLFVDCTNRVEINQYYFKEKIITCDANLLEDQIIDQHKSEAYLRSLISTFEIYLSMNKKVPSDAIKNITSAKDLSTSVDIATSNLTISDEKKLLILHEKDLETRINEVMRTLLNEIEVLKEEKAFQDRVKSHIEKNQKEYYLHEQMKLIRKDLGESDDVGEIASKYEQKLNDNKNLSQEAREKITDEIKKLKNTSPSSSEFGVIKSYLDLVFDLPWKKFSKEQTNLDKADQELSQSHFGMDKTKQRIIEHIAVQINIKKPTGVVLCLYGPPGVGKTTFARSIAKAMNREYAKISLGGLHDASELFGHRKTYIGAMPGKIINAMKKVKTSNPVILLDEIDKLSSDHRGDPASVLLEILDPEQNKTFTDHYLDIGFDISNVFFIATANSLNIPAPLRDRMEIINIPSYLEKEKLEIAKKYLIPTKFAECGIDIKKVKFEEDSIKHIIEKYTRESGVRELERCISKIARKNIVKLLKNNNFKEIDDQNFQLISENHTSSNQIIEIKKNSIKEYLGVEKFSYSELEDESMVGVVNGLAYTSVGGDVLIIEAIKTTGKGLIKFTGSLGDVMKESIQAGYTYIKANRDKFGIKDDMNKFDIHIHAPEGATPKDGPSAGITICTAIISVLTNQPVRSDIAMTGEITLRGKVLGIGGLREKLTSAVRSKQITEVAIPFSNIKDLEEIPEDITGKLKIHPCKTFDDVFNVVFAKSDKKSRKSVATISSKKMKVSANVLL